MWWFLIYWAVGIPVPYLIERFFPEFIEEERPTSWGCFILWAALAWLWPIAIFAAILVAIGARYGARVQKFLKTTVPWERKYWGNYGAPKEKE